MNVETYLLKPKLGHALTASLLPGFGPFTDKNIPNAYLKKTKTHTVGLNKTYAK